MPSTLPFYDQSLEEIMQGLSMKEKEGNETHKIGKVRIMKSGKVVLRLEDQKDQNKYSEFELIKGI